jgi:hypothetical protein
MEELKKKLLEEFKAATQQIIKGEILGYETLLAMGDVEDYLNSIGTEHEDGMSTNGWEWDWGNCYIIDGKKYQLGGSGYYGGLSFEKGDDD